MTPLTKVALSPKPLELQTWDWSHCAGNFIFLPAWSFKKFLNVHYLADTALYGCLSSMTSFDYKVLLMRYSTAWTLGYFVHMMEEKK